MIGTSFGIAFGALFGLLIGIYIELETYSLIVGAGIGLFIGYTYDRKKKA